MFLSISRAGHKKLIENNKKELVLIMQHLSLSLPLYLCSATREKINGRLSLCLAQQSVGQRMRDEKTTEACDTNNE
jgi:hypothetical protein